MYRRVLMLAYCVGLSACGSSSTPAAPTPPPAAAQIGGNWSGTLESGNYQPVAVFVTLSQTNSTVTGTWAAQSGTSGIAGNISGTVDPTSFTGTITFSINQTAGCSGSFSGNASSTANLTWSSAGFTGNCNVNLGNPVSPRFVLQRR
jgi:hypothetical protein